MRNSSSLTVVVMSQGHPTAIHSSLQSLSQQSLDFQRLTILLVVVGADPSHLIPLKYETSNLDIQLLYIEDLESSAEELGIMERVTGEYITFIYEGDRLSPTFLELLLGEAEENVVPISQIVETESNAPASWTTNYNRAGMRHEASSSQGHLDDGPIMTEIAGKVIHRSGLNEITLMHAVSRKGLLFNVSLALVHEFGYSRLPAALGATYYRTSAEPSATFDKDTGATAELVSALETLRKSNLSEVSGKQRELLAASISGQLQSANLYIPPCTREIILQKISEVGLRDISSTVLDETVSTLAVVANFAPYAGTAGIVAAKRIIEDGKRVDLISSSISSRKRQDADLRLTEGLIRVHNILNTTPNSTVDEEISEFIDDGLSEFEGLQMRGARYTNLYSRAMVPHSHFLAAAIKRRNPAVVWVAEFSDPLSLTVKATSRTAAFTTPAVIDKFIGWGSFSQQRLLLEETRMPRWAELLAFFFADSLIFTNQYQLETMLDYAPADFRGRIESKATVARHPTLPAQYYEMGTPRWRHDTGVITLAYFGDFHSTRGMGEVLEGLSRLDWEVLQKFRLVIFTDSKQHYIHGKLPEDLSRVVEVQPRLDYLDFLATLNEMCVLIVNDSLTSEYFAVNPYLPSKVSDYMGSNTPIWAIYEAGSVLSEMNFTYKSPLGDVAEAEKVLKQIFSNDIRR